MKGNAISALVNKDIIIFIFTKKYVVFRFSAFCNILLFFMLWKTQSKEELDVHF